MKTLHPATVAWSIYNALAVFYALPIDEDAIFNMLQQRWASNLDGATFEDALEGLVAKRLIERSGGKIDMVDPKRRALVKRARDGDGWGDWEIEREPGTVKQQVLSRIVPSQPVGEVLP